jgi:hypothetical protein
LVSFVPLLGKPKADLGGAKGTPEGVFESGTYSGGTLYCIFLFEAQRGQFGLYQSDLIYQYSPNSSPRTGATSGDPFDSRPYDYTSVHFMNQNTVVAISHVSAVSNSFAGPTVADAWNYLGKHGEKPRFLLHSGSRIAPSPPF